MAFVFIVINTDMSDYALLAGVASQGLDPRDAKLPMQYSCEASAATVSTKRKINVKDTTWP